MFKGRSRAWLEAARDAAEEELSKGKTTISGGLGEVNYSAALTVGPTQRLKHLLYALNQIAPADYPIDDISVPTRTFATFNTAL